MHTSEDIKDIAAALAKAQGEIEGAVKDKVNPAFKSKYADLAAVWDAIRTPLSKNGLSVVQITDMEGDGNTVLVTRLLHSSGQWISARYPVRPVQATPQGLGSALTYARRYSLMALVGIAPEDDDGNAASQGTPQQQQAPRQQQRPSVSQQPTQERTPFDSEPADATPLDKIEDPRELAKRMVALIVQADSLKEVNDFLLLWGEQRGKDEPKPGSLLAKLPDGGKWVMERAENRRGVLAQAPGQRAA